MKENQITETSIRQLVDSFYAKVMKDETLSPIFREAIGEDPQIWEFHMQRMYGFWSSVLLGTGVYHGNPLQKHRNLPTFDISLFDRWLSLFAETAHHLYAVEIADLLIEKSKRIADSLKLGLFYTLKKNENGLT
jgi:hemoglobin